MVVEGYLCGMLLHQENAGRHTVVALGSASVGPNEEVQAVLARAGTILVAHESDEFGLLFAPSEE